MPTSTKRPRRLLDAYRFPGFRPQATVKGVFGNPKARVITLVRRGKKPSAGVVAGPSPAGTTASCGASATCGVARRVWLEFEVRRVDCRACDKVKTERLDFLADNRFYTKRFAWHIGRRCRQSSVSDVAKEFKLDWQTVKALNKHYMTEQLKRARMPGPKAIGIDEISIRKGTRIASWSAT